MKLKIVKIEGGKRVFSVTSSSRRTEYHTIWEVKGDKLICRDNKRTVSSGDHHKDMLQSEIRNLHGKKVDEYLVEHKK